MEIILKEAVFNLGRAGDIVIVKDGYAFNKLIPSGVAIPASRQAKVEIEKLRAQNAAKDAKFTEIANAVKAVIAGKPVFLEKVVNDFGVLYGAVTPLEITEYLNKNYHVSGFLYPKGSVVIPAKVRSAGAYDIDINLYYGVSCKVKLVVARSLVEAEAMFKRTNIAATEAETEEVA